MAGVRLQDVADHAGVSMKTVSNVVRDHPNVSPQMRARVQSAIDELGYRPNALGRRLATGRTGLLALAFADIRLPYFAELANLVAATASTSDAGYRVLLEETGGTLDGERAVLNASESGLVDGMLFQPAIMTLGEIDERHGDIPIVLLGEGAAPLSVDRVMIDNEAAAMMATGHLVGLGRSRIAFLGHEITQLTATSQQRIEGYRRGLEHAGLSADPALLIATLETGAVSARAAVGAAIDAGLRFDGLVCRDDLAAIGALRALHERGIAVPHDVAVVGWDDTSFAATTYPSLTSIAPDTATLASMALEMLEERIAGFDGTGRHRLAPFQLTVRESAPSA